MSGDPAPDAITLLTIVDGAAAPGAYGSRSPATPTSAASIARRDILTTPAVEPLGQGARHRAQAAQALLVPLRDARPPQPGRALPDRAAARLARDRPLRLLLLRRLHPRLLQRVRRARARGPRLRRLARRLHLRRGVQRVRRRPRGARRHDRQAEPVLPDDAARGRDAARVPGQVRALPHRPVAAPACTSCCPMVATWDDHEVQNNYANDADDGGLPLRRRFSRARRDAAYQAFFESMPVFARAAVADLPDAALRPHRRADDARPAPVPRGPAVQRRARLPVPHLGPARARCSAGASSGSSSRAWRRRRRRGRSSAGSR